MFCVTVDMQFLLFRCTMQPTQSRLCGDGSRFLLLPSRFSQEKFQRRPVKLDRHMGRIDLNRKIEYTEDRFATPTQFAVLPMRIHPVHTRLAAYCDLAGCHPDLNRISHENSSVNLYP